jgi:hypothetical protein
VDPVPDDEKQNVALEALAKGRTPREVLRPTSKRRDAEREAAREEEDGSREPVNVLVPGEPRGVAHRRDQHLAKGVPLDHQDDGEETEQVQREEASARGCRGLVHREDGHWNAREGDLGGGIEPRRWAGFVERSGGRRRGRAGQNQTSPGRVGDDQAERYHRSPTDRPLSLVPAPGHPIASDGAPRLRRIAPRARSGSRKSCTSG